MTPVHVPLDLPRRTKRHRAWRAAWRDYRHVRGPHSCRRPGGARAIVRVATSSTDGPIMHLEGQGSAWRFLLHVGVPVDGIVFCTGDRVCPASTSSAHSRIEQASRQRGAWRRVTLVNKPIHGGHGIHLDPGVEKPKNLGVKKPTKAFRNFQRYHGVHLRNWQEAHVFRAHLLPAAPIL